MKQLSAEQIESVQSCMIWCDLPHKVSSRTEIDSMLQHMFASLKRLPFRPSIVTVACSATDGFLPAKDVKWIIQKLMNALREWLGDIQIMPEPDVAHYLK